MKDGGNLKEELKTGNKVYDSVLLFENLIENVENNSQNL